jgi:Family of unknown function (DUF6281)
MRGIVAGTCVVLLCAGCGTAHRAAVKRVPPCRTAITWHENLYYPHPVVALPARGASLGLAGVPSCTDVLGGENGASRAVDVTEIAGIDPRVAIAVFGDWDHAYVAAGHSLRLPGS